MSNLEIGNPELSIVVPVFNSQLSLRTLLARLSQVRNEIGMTMEVILVNDGSRDGSWSVVCELMRDYAEVIGVDLMRNFGQHNALLCGIMMAKGKIIVTVDDDLQHPVEEIPKLLAALTPEVDVVYGSPLEEQHGLWRDLASLITKTALSSAMGAKTACQVSAFRVFRTSLRHAFTHYRGPHVSIDVLLTWATERFVSVKVRHDLRQFGKSNYTFSKLLVHALNMVTGFSTIPLRLASIMGFAFTMFGVLILCYVLGCYLWQGGGVAGFPFLASIVAIFSGAQLFALGVIGEYLARMYFRSMDRPLYVVKSIMSTDTAGGAMLK